MLALQAEKKSRPTYVNQQTTGNGKSLSNVDKSVLALHDLYSLLHKKTES